MAGVAQGLRTNGGEGPCSNANDVQIPAQASADHQQPSTGELVKRLSEQVSVLVRDELKLAQLEMTRKGKQAGIGAGMLGGSGLIALYGVACLLACAILGLSRVLEPWLAALIVGAALLLVSGVAALLGKAPAEEGRPAGPGAGHRQREGRCQRDQGKGAPMSIEGKVVDAAPGPPDDPQGLQQEIERTREHLGETVEALMAKVDVKARAQDEAGRLIGRLKARVVQARQQAAARAAGHGAGGRQDRRAAPAGHRAGPHVDVRSPTRRPGRCSRRRPSAGSVARRHLEGHPRAGQAGGGQRRRHRQAAAHAAARGGRRGRRGPGRLAALPALEAARMKLLNRAIGLLVGILGGMLARSVFKRIWQAVTGEDEAPTATDARRGWREILLAAALQGAIFAVVQAALDRATAEGTAKLTGEWPGEGADEQSGHGSDEAASKSDHGEVQARARRRGIAGYRRARALGGAPAPGERGRDGGATVRSS